MSIAYDNQASSLTFSTGVTVSITPVGTPRGVIVYVGQRTPVDDTITGITYGGVSMTEMSDSPFLGTNAEAAALYGYFLGSGIPTGTQNAVVTATASRAKIVQVITLTAAADLEENIAEQLMDSDNVNNPRVTLTLASAVDSFVSEIFMSGKSSVGGFSPISGWTSRSESDMGSNGIGVYTYDTISSADVSCGYDNSGSGENVQLYASAFNEISGGSTQLVSLDLDNLQSIGEVTLTQGNILAVQDISNTQELTTPMLAEKTNLTTNNLNQIQDLSVVDMSSSSSLALADLEQLSTITSIGLVQQSNLNTNNIENAQELSIASLVQKAVLSVSNLEQLSTISNVSLVNQSSITLQNIEQDHQLTNATLIQNNNLLLNGIESAQDVTSPTLTQANILTVSAIETAQEASNVSLAIAGVLGVASLVQTQSTTEPNLNQNSLLSVDGIEQSHTLSIASLLQKHVLFVNGLESGNGLTASTLSANSISLLVDGIEQLQPLSNISLIQVSILSVDDLTTMDLISAVSFGGIATGYMKGELSIFSVYNGSIMVSNATTGETKVFNSTDLS